MNKSIVLMTVLAMALVSTGAEAAHTLPANHALYPGDRLVSSNGAYQLILQASDGNLVVYRIADMKAIWATNVPGGAIALMQQDRNFVVYRNANASNPIWASNTGGSIVDTGAYLLLSDTGALSVVTSAGTTIWTTPGDCTPKPYLACYLPGSPFQSTFYIMACTYNEALAIAARSAASLGGCPMR
ncbi:hypothetical protein F0U61_25680 [Archangium violaceum]|uniref:hypothetical protein n=1 Tax=Archangium violaceum TaxID=83451 RepID=UPI002B2F78C1|nr:hypothetical protein F0U61_25680 [Archangium violaceum]